MHAERPITSSIDKTRELQRRLYLRAKREVAFWSDVAGYQNRDGQSLESSKKKVVGEPDEGKPHVRFDVAGDGNQDMVMVLRHSQKKWRATGCFHLRLRRHPLTLPADSGYYYPWGFGDDPYIGFRCAASP